MATTTKKTRRIGNETTGVLIPQFIVAPRHVVAEGRLYYYGARYFEPNIALWYGVDPLTEK